MWLWSRMVLLVGALAVLMVAGAIAAPTSIPRAVSNGIVLIGIMIVGTALNRRKAAKFQRRIEELDTLRNGEA